MNPLPINGPVLLDPEARRDGLYMPDGTRALLLIAHPDGASRDHPGHGFVADVLRANGFATLPFSLHTPDEEAIGAAPPGMVQSRLRIRAVFDWLSLQPALGARPVALIGLDDAVPACIAAAAGQHMAGLRALILLDGHAESVPHHLQHLSLPTLFVLGRCDARRLARHRAATRDMSARHQLEVLPSSTRPCPAPGALEAFVCLALEWLDQTLPPRDEGSGGGSPDREAGGRCAAPNYKHGTHWGSAQS